MSDVRAKCCHNVASTSRMQPGPRHRQTSRRPARQSRSWLSPHATQQAKQASHAEPPHAAFGNRTKRCSRQMPQTKPGPGLSCKRAVTVCALWRAERISASKRSAMGDKEQSLLPSSSSSMPKVCSHPGQRHANRKRASRKHLEASISSHCRQHGPQAAWPQDADVTTSGPALALQIWHPLTHRRHGLSIRRRPSPKAGRAGSSAAQHRAHAVWPQMGCLTNATTPIWHTLHVSTLRSAECACPQPGATSTSIGR
mmetsp:Transcript_32724/g.98958  ORF Transcript_32724/g.98958 Transcript_32724/m.98958 type:complete len:255 (-) Transcript_32724:139-903(-)